MSHCLTQPEEIDRILMAMAGHDMEVDMPIQGGVQLSGAIRDVKRDELAAASGFTYGETHMKSSHSLSGP